MNYADLVWQIHIPGEEVAHADALSKRCRGNVANEVWDALCTRCDFIFRFPAAFPPQRNMDHQFLLESVQ